MPLKLGAKEEICASINHIDSNMRTLIAKLLVARIDSKVIEKYCYDSADGTRINLDKLSELDNYEIIITEIYNIIFDDKLVM